MTPIAEIREQLKPCHKCGKPPAVADHDGAVLIRCRKCEYGIRAEDHVAIIVWNRLNG